MAETLKLMIGRAKTFTDYSELIQKVTFSGRKGAAPRSLEVVLYDNKKLGANRASVNCSEGQTVIYYVDGVEQFRGLLMSESYSSKNKLTIKAYDNLVYATNNKASFSYKKKTATTIINDCCKKLGLTVGSAVDTKTKIGELVKKNSTYWDVMEDALSQTYKKTGKRYYICSEKGKIYLRRRIEQTTMPIIELATNVELYTRTRSIEDTKTRLKLTTSKGKSKGSTTVESLEKKIGKFQDVQNVDADISRTEINQLIKTFREEEAVVDQSLKVDCLGNIDVKSGGCVYVYITDIGAKRIMYVDEDTHTWSDGVHKMTLKLNYANDINKAG